MDTLIKFFKFLFTVVIWEPLSAFWLRLNGNGPEAFWYKIILTLAGLLLLRWLLRKLAGLPLLMVFPNGLLAFFYLRRRFGK